MTGSVVAGAVLLIAALYASCTGGGEGTADTGAGAGNAKPYARLRSPVRVTTGEAATFDGGDSRDSDGVIVEYRFLFGDGSPEASLATPTVTHLYTVEGTYDVRFAVRDDTGAVAEVRRTIEVVAEMGAYTCTADAGCEPFVQECVDRRCWYVGGSSGCETDADCANGYFCSDAVCRPSKR